MDKYQALELQDKLVARNAYYKTLDIASQLTQINALKKILSDADLLGERSTALKSCLEKRTLVLQMSVDCLEALENQGWLPVLEAWQAMVNPKGE